MPAVATPQLETGWLSTTPVEDNVLRQFVHRQAVVNSITALSVGGRNHDDESPSALFSITWMLCTVLGARPFAGPFSPGRFLRPPLRSAA